MRLVYENDEYKGKTLPSYRFFADLSIAVQQELLKDLEYLGEQGFNLVPYEQNYTDHHLHKLITIEPLQVDILVGWSDRYLQVNKGIPKSRYNDYIVDLTLCHPNPNGDTLPWYTEYTGEGPVSFRTSWESDFNKLDTDSRNALITCIKNPIIKFVKNYIDEYTQHNVDSSAITNRNRKKPELYAVFDSYEYDDLIEQEVYGWLNARNETYNFRLTNKMIIDGFRDQGVDFVKESEIDPEIYEDDSYFVISAKDICNEVKQLYRDSL